MMYQVVHSIMRGYNIKCIKTGAYMLNHWTQNKDYVAETCSSMNKESADARATLGNSRPNAMEYR